MDVLKCEDTVHRQALERYLNDETLFTLAITPTPPDENGRTPIGASRRRTRNRPGLTRLPKT